MPFVKLDCGILDSSLWTEREQRDLFITALLMAVPYFLPEDTEALQCEGYEKLGFTVPSGWYGIVRASSMGIIGRSRLDSGEISFKAIMEELQHLTEPDPWSRSTEFEGRRMVRISGGFIILNYAKHREMDRTGAERQQKYRARKSRDSNAVTSVTSRNGNVSSRAKVTQAEAEAEAEAEDKKENPLLFPLKGEGALPKISKKKSPNISPRPDSKEQCIDHVVRNLNLTEEDGRALWDHWVGNGFKNNGKRMESWRHTASCWQRKGYFFPSLQKQK